MSDSLSHNSGLVSHHFFFQTILNKLGKPKECHEVLPSDNPGYANKTWTLNRGEQSHEDGL